MKWTFFWNVSPVFNSIISSTGRGRGKEEGRREIIGAKIWMTQIKILAVFHCDFAGTVLSIGDIWQSRNYSEFSDLSFSRIYIHIYI